MKADKGAAASGFCPPIPLGVFQAKACSLLKKKKKLKKKLKALKESYRQLLKKKTKNKHTQNPNRSPISPPASPQHNSCLSSFLSFFYNLPATSPSGRPRGQLLVGGDRHTEGRAHLWPVGGGNTSPYCILNPDTHQPACPLALSGSGGKTRWSPSMSNEHL